jgi:polar amino acid transport system permease protein
MDYHWLTQYGSLIFSGFCTTLQLTVYSAVIGFGLAIVVALCRVSRNGILAQASLAFTTTIRGTPLLVQIFIFYYGLGELFSGSDWLRESALWPYLRDGFWYVVVALTISVAAYLGEVVRGGILAVPKGELEAASAFGMSRACAFRRVLLPRALHKIAPILTGETVLHLKSTALASTVAVVDLLGAAGQVRSTTFLVYEPLLLVAVIYLVLTLIIEAVGRLLERQPYIHRASAAA